MKATQMSPVHEANLVANSDNSTYGSSHEGAAVLLPGFAIIW